MLSLRQCEAVMSQSSLELVRFDVHGFRGKGYPLSRSLAGLAKVPVLRELFHSCYTAVLCKP